MTATSSSIGLRAPARRPFGRLAAAAVSFLLATSALGASPAAAADENAESDIVLNVAPMASVAPETPFAAAISIINSSDEDLTEGELTLEIDRTPLADDEALETWLDDGTAPGTFDELVSQASEPVDAGASTELSAVVAENVLGSLAPGVYPLRATLDDATTGSGDDATPQNLTAESVLVVQAARPANVNVVVPITATPEDEVVLTAKELIELTGPDGALTAVLDGVSGTSAILAIDPAIPAAIRMLGSKAPTTATDWLTRFDSLPNDRFALLFGDADAATQAHAGLDTLLGPADLTALMKPENFAAATPTPTPTPTADEAEPELPDNAALTAVPGATSGILWPRADVTSRDLTSFRQYLGDDVKTILPDTSLAGTAGAHGSARGAEVLVTDADASDRLSDAVAADDATARDSAIAAAAGHLYFASAANPAAGLLVGLDRSDSRDADDLRAAILAVATSQSGIDGMLASPSTPVRSTATADDSRAASLSTLLADEERLRAFSSILDDPDVLLTPERIQILRTIAVGVSDDAFPDRVKTHRAETVEILDAVGIQKPSPVQLFTSAAPLPVWVRNDLRWPVNVTLIAQPSDPRLNVQRSTPVEAQPSSNTRVTVPVEARVASGELQVGFRLTSPTGVPIGLPATADVTVRADWEGIGLGVLGALIVLLLGVGVGRTVLRRRRAQADAEADADADADTGTEASEASE